MTSSVKYFLLLPIYCWLTSCQFQSLKPKNLNLGEQFVSAYNQHDAEQMLSLTHDNIKYMFINTDQIFTETENKSELIQFLKGYFSSNPQAKSRVIESKRHGSFINQIEQALWTDKSGQEKSQCSLSVYELRNELIINVWYFNAYNCPK